MSSSNQHFHTGDFVNVEDWARAQGTGAWSGVVYELRADGWWVREFPSQWRRCETS